MRPATAEAVADMLCMVETLLKKGRPRKNPYGKRPDATTWRGTPIKRYTRQMNFLDIEKVSLTAAFRIAQVEGGYNAYQRMLAEDEFRWAYDGASGHIYTVPSIDRGELDTRLLIRAARKARKSVEKTYLPASV